MQAMPSGTLLLFVFLAGIISTAETPIETTPCELTRSPEKFDGKLVRLDAYISHAFESYPFEEFKVHHPDCPDEAPVNLQYGRTTIPSIWVDYANSSYFRTKLIGRPKLVNDDLLKQFRKLLQERSPQMTHATLLGTFHAGERLDVEGLAEYGGFGHLGCCSLFTVSRVLSVQAAYPPELSYSWAAWHVDLPQGCFSETRLGLPTNYALEQWQEQVNEGMDLWRYDPRLSAEKHLASLRFGAEGQRYGGSTEVVAPGKSRLEAPKDKRPREVLLETESTTYKKTYEWLEADGKTRYVVVMTRPYWLLQFTSAPDKVIWAPSGASVINCDPKSKKK